MSGIIGDNIGRSSGLIKAAGGGGKIGQVLSTTLNTQPTTTSATFADITGFAVAITPAATSSKIFITVGLSLGGQVGYSCQLRIMRDSTAICLGTATGLGGRVQATWHFKSYADGALQHRAMNFLDSPSSTSEISYNVEWRETENTTLYLNRSFSSSDNTNYPFTASNITVMEVLA